MRLGAACLSVSRKVVIMRKLWAKPDECLSLILCAVLVLVMFACGDGTVKSIGKHISALEMSFVAAYLFFYRSFNAVTSLNKLHPLLFVLCLLWGGMSLISFAQLFTTIDVTGKELRSAGYRQFFIICHVLFFMAVASYLEKTRIPPSRYLMLIAVSVTILGLVCMPAKAFVDYYVNEAHFTRYPLFTNRRHAGWLALAGVVCIVGLLHRRQHTKVMRSFLIVVLAVNSVFLLQTGGRAAIGLLLLLAVSSLVALCLSRKVKLLHAFIFCTLLLFASFLGGFVFEELERFWFSIVEIANIKTLKTQWLASLSSERSLSWVATWQVALEKPWLGWGPNAYIRIPADLYGSQPHNFVLQFFAEWGFVAGGALALVIIGFVSQGLYLGLKRGDNHLMTVSVVSAALTINSLFSGPYYHNQGVFFVVLFVGMTAAAKLTTAPKNSNSPSSLCHVDSSGNDVQ